MRYSLSSITVHFHSNLNVLFESTHMHKGCSFFSSRSCYYSLIDTASPIYIQMRDEGNTRHTFSSPLSLHRLFLSPRQYFYYYFFTLFQTLFFLFSRPEGATFSLLNYLFDNIIIVIIINRITVGWTDRWIYSGVLGTPHHSISPKSAPVNRCARNLLWNICTCPDALFISCFFTSGPSRRWSRLLCAYTRDDNFRGTNLKSKRGWSGFSQPRLYVHQRWGSSFGCQLSSATRANTLQVTHTHAHTHTYEFIDQEKSYSNVKKKKKIRPCRDTEIWKLFLNEAFVRTFSHSCVRSSPLIQTHLVVWISMYTFVHKSSGGKGNKGWRVQVRRELFHWCERFHFLVFFFIFEIFLRSRKSREPSSLIFTFPLSVFSCSSRFVAAFVTSN